MCMYNMNEVIQGDSLSQIFNVLVLIPKALLVGALILSSILLVL